MRRIVTIISLLLSVYLLSAQDSNTLLRLVRMPLKSITTEYPNKTGQVINDEADARLTPSQLHPVFFGSFDWHSSVHSHWMLVHTLRIVPDSPSRRTFLFQSVVYGSYSEGFTGE